MIPLLRQIRPDEYAPVGELLAQTYEPYVISPTYLDKLRDVEPRAADSMSEVLVALDQETGELLGTTVLSYAGSPLSYLAGEADAELRMLGVSLTARRRRIGSTLVDESIARARLAGKRRMILGTMSNMPDAQRMYEALGFTKIEERDETAGFRLYVYTLDLAPAPEIRLARPSDYDHAGEVTLSAYAGDGLLPPGSDSVHPAPAAFGRTGPPHSYADELRDAKRRAEDAELWVAVSRDTGSVLGTSTYCPVGSPYREIARDDEGEFRMLGVAPTARGLGVGELLVRAMLRRARDEGMSGVAMSSAHKMATAHRLYDRLAFHRDPTRDWSPIPGHELLAYAREV
ncbi:GNAT family N-acetyltransferase [Flindersiella endophytica]